MTCSTKHCITVQRTFEQNVHFLMKARYLAHLFYIPLREPPGDILDFATFLNVRHIIKTASITIHLCLKENGFKILHFWTSPAIMSAF